MSSTTLQSHSYTLAGPRAVGGALNELSAAAAKFLKALPAGLQSRSPSKTRPQSLSEEACRVRELALGYVKTDPGFAADLFAAADRHEQIHGL